MINKFLFKKSGRLTKNLERSPKFLNYVLKSRKMKWVVFLKKAKVSLNRQRPYRVPNNYRRDLLKKRSNIENQFHISKRLAFCIVATGLVISRGLAISMIKQGCVFVNGRKVLFYNISLVPGDLVQVKCKEKSKFFLVSNNAKIQKKLTNGFEVSFSTKSFVVCF